MTRVSLVAPLAALTAVASAGAAPRRAEVYVQFSAYGPSQLDVLPGTKVVWSNVSARTHTVTAYDGSFDSGRIAPGGRFAFTFTRVGVNEYHCRLHPSIVGEVDVRRVILDTLPTAAVPLGSNVDFSGITADAGSTIRIERRVAGTSFTRVATTTATRSGTWHVDVRATTTGDYRALSGADASQVRRVLVRIRKNHIRATRTGVSVEVTPSQPYAPILVEAYRRERFGWWPVLRSHLDYVSAADIHLHRPARVRIVLVDRDGWTPIATSRPVTLGSR